jgi:hypothetical protein
MASEPDCFSRSQSSSLSALCCDTRVPGSVDRTEGVNRTWLAGEEDALVQRFVQTRAQVRLAR